MIRKKCILILVLAVIGSLITVSVLFVSCDSREEKGSQTSQQQEEWKQKIKVLKTTLINRHNAIVFPPKDFGTRKVFTYNLQIFLINKDGRPVLFDGTLEDITKDNDHFTIHFSSYLAEYELPGLQSLGRLFDERRIRFHLKCKYEDVKPLLDNPPKYEDEILDMLLFSKKEEFCVVGLIKQVNKIIKYTVQGYPVSQEDVELEIESPDVFSVAGELVEMLKYPEKKE
jgi:hypothetical protein